MTTSKPEAMPELAGAAAVRRFNRLYTRQIGVLAEGLLRSPFSLTEARVLFELAARPGLTAAELRRLLGLDAGYLSRILGRFGKRGLVTRARSASDAREGHIALTPRGRRAFAVLDRRSSDEAAALLAQVPPEGRERLLAAMGEIEALLGGTAPAEAPLLLRPAQPGDLGWVVQRHGALYAREEGYDQRFEGLVAQIAADFAASHDPLRERMFIAARAGERLGSVLVVAKAKTVARLRLLLVEPAARGQGVGKALVDECVRFAREAGYRKLTLWTQRDLRAARRLYGKAGFRLTDAQAHRSFGRDLVGETWELEL